MALEMWQPPSGGCVLKRRDAYINTCAIDAAAFGRLCVETGLTRLVSMPNNQQPPSGGCVLKLNLISRS